TYYEKFFDKLTASFTDSLTEKEFRIRLKLAMNELHCGHSEIFMSKAYSKAVKPMKLNWLPYHCMAINNKLYTIMPVNAKKDSTIKQGSEILKINNVSVDSILNFSRRMISGDGFIENGKNLSLRYGINYFYPGLFGRPDSFLIESKIGDTIKIQYVKACNLKDLPTLPIGTKEDSLLNKHKRANISEGYVGSDKELFVLKIRSFKSSRYKKIYRRVFRTLRKNKTENLVIDLRNNGGGNLANSYRLLKYLMETEQTITLKTHVKNYPDKKYTKGNIRFKLTKYALKKMGTKKVNGDSVFYIQKIKPYKKEHYTGKLYVLINGWTFSASCIIAAYLKNNKNATLVGRETGGTNEGCNAGITPYYVLPNTKLKVRIPAFRIIHDIDPALTGHGILPNHEINYSFEDILKRTDLEMKFVKELIKK
ncbi:MAG TPA: S41 family peptidase, partial [Bacteroidia bacterium]|nr:S41 family peptidase [Bacteroidia bacterium]